MLYMIFKRVFVSATSSFIFKEEITLFFLLILASVWKNLVFFLHISMSFTIDFSFQNSSFRFRTFASTCVASRNSLEELSFISVIWIVPPWSTTMLCSLLLTYVVSKFGSITTSTWIVGSRTILLSSSGVVFFPVGT